MRLFKDALSIGLMVLLVVGCVARRGGAGGRGGPSDAVVASIKGVKILAEHDREYISEAVLACGVKDKDGNFHPLVAKAQDISLKVEGDSVELGFKLTAGELGRVEGGACRLELRGKKLDLKDRIVKWFAEPVEGTGYAVYFTSPTAAFSRTSMEFKLYKQYKILSEHAKEVAVALDFQVKEDFSLVKGGQVPAVLACNATGGKAKRDDGDFAWAFDPADNRCLDGQSHPTLKCETAKFDGTSYEDVVVFRFYPDTQDFAETACLVELALNSDKSLLFSAKGADTFDFVKLQGRTVDNPLPLGNMREIKMSTVATGVDAAFEPGVCKFDPYTVCSEITVGRTDVTTWGGAFGSAPVEGNYRWAVLTKGRRYGEQGYWLVTNRELENRALDRHVSLDKLKGESDALEYYEVYITKDQSEFDLNLHSQTVKVDDQGRPVENGEYADAAIGEDKTKLRKVGYDHFKVVEFSYENNFGMVRAWKTAVSKDTPVWAPLLPENKQ